MGLGQIAIVLCIIILVAELICMYDCYVDIKSVPSCTLLRIDRFDC